MTPSRYKSIALKILFTGIFLILLSPLYMYFSHDVEKLNKFYPHPVITNNSISFELKESKPKNWVKLNQISQFARGAIIFSEDWGFFQHRGIDQNQVKVALNEMISVKRFRGASTITQQMVKNIYLYEDKTLWRKIHEYILTHKVEQVMKKDRILEIYLNCIEFGPGIYGIRDASYHYFKKSPSLLNPKESAFLAMLLPSPKRYYISFKKRQLTPFARTRIEEILVKMRMGKLLTPAQYKIEKMAKLSWEK